VTKRYGHPRNLALLFVLAAIIAIALPSFAANSAKPVTVDQLQQTLFSLHGKPDTEIAQQLADLQLTERLSNETLARLKADSPGTLTAQQLDLLADRSAFQPLPAAEIPSTPAMDGAQQRKLLALTVNYVSQTVHQMPNFLATRDTRGYVDRPEGLFGFQPLHLIGQSTATVMYRDGREVDSAVAGKRGGRAAKTDLAGLVSRGEFGPILSTVLLDAAHSQLSWSHWETGPAGPIAVFRYQVPSKQSHYDLGFSYSVDTSSAYHWLPGYHGELSIDPDTGSILRLTAMADLTVNSPLDLASIMVEYGQVEIAGKNYICPLHSIAVAQRVVSEDSRFGNSPVMRVPSTTMLNAVRFSHYHVFRGETRILTEAEAKSTEDLQTQAEPPAVPQEPAPPAVAENTAPEAAPVTSTPPANPSTAPPSPEATPAPLSSSATTTPPDISQTPIFRTTTRQVLFDVVVTKDGGGTVTGLGRQDFVVAEDGKPQTIDFFEEHKPGDKPAASAPNMPPLPAGAVSNASPEPIGDSVNVLLLDTLNTERVDQSYVHTQIIEFLKKLQPGTQVAIFVLSSRLHFVQGFTSDTSLLLAALNDKKKGAAPTRDPMAHGRSDDADDAAALATLQAMRAGSSGIEALQTSQQQMKAYSLGARATMTFEALDQLAHYLEGVPGRKNLMWFAGSFPVIFFPTPEQRAAIEKNPNMPGYMDQVKKTADLFTLSKIAVYPIGAQGVMSEHIMEADTPTPGGGVSVGHAGSNANTMAPFNAAAAERSNTIYAMEQLASSTGGKAFYNANGLDEAMKRALDDGAHYYTIGYAPTNSKMDGSFRRVDVKVPGGKYKLAHRAGYNADSGIGSSSAAPTTDPLSEMLVYGLPNTTSILYGVRVAPQPPNEIDNTQLMGENANLKGPIAIYSVDFTIRASDLDLTQNADKFTGRILLGLKAFDADGTAVNWLAVSRDLELTAGEMKEAQQSGFPAHLLIGLPKNPNLRLVTAVYDWSTSRSGSLSIPISQ
jgi:VWFA-related protein